MTAPAVTSTLAAADRRRALGAVAAPGRRPGRGRRRSRCRRRRRPRVRPRSASARDPARTSSGPPAAGPSSRHHRTARLDLQDERASSRSVRATRTRPARPSVACRVVELSGSWRALAADDELRRDGIGLDVDDSDVAEVDVPGPLALGDPAGQERRADPVPPALRPAGPRRRQAPLDHVRRDLLPGRRVARRRLPRRSGGLLLPAQLRRHRPVAARRRPRARRRGDVQPRVGHDRPAQHHRPVPALRGRRPGLEPGRHLATGARLRHRARSSSTGSACCAATPTRPAPTCACTPASTATSPAPSACARRPTASSSARPSTRSRPAPTRSTGRSTSTGRSCGGRAPSATSR